MNIGLLFQTLGISLVILGFAFTFFQKKPTVFSYWNRVQDIYGDIIGDKYFDRARVEIQPFEINKVNPNAELGYDSVYALNIVTPTLITNFAFSVKLPRSASKEMPISLYNDDNVGETAWYEPEIKNGTAFFNVRNAGGEYHLVLSHTNIENLSTSDISW